MEKEVREVRREAEGAGPTSEDPRPPSIGADADSSSVSSSLSQHTLSQYALSQPTPATAASPWDTTFLSQGPLLDSASRILDLSQYPMADYTSNSEFTLSQHPLQESTISERLEPLGVEETEADNGLGAVNRWFALQEDTDSPVKRPLHNLAHNLSLGAVELAMMEITQEEDKDSVDRHVSEVSSNLIEGILSLTEHSIKTTPGQDSLMLQGLDSVSNMDSTASLLQHTFKTTPGQDSTASLSQHTFKSTPDQDSLMLQGLDSASNKDGTHGSKSSLSQQSLGEETISQHALSISRESGFSTSGTSSDQTRTMQNELKHVSDSLMSGPLEGNVTNQLSSTADQTMQFQPLVQSMTIGDSYLEKRPISSSTPSAVSKISELKDYSVASNSPSLDQPHPAISKPNDVAGVGESGSHGPARQSNSPQESGSSSLSGSMTTADLKEPMALIHKAGVENYMTPDERACLVPAPPPETIITREEREEIFSDIFRAPPPGELSRSRSGSQRSLAGSEKSSKSDKHSTISEPETKRVHSKYSTGDRMSLITPGVSHAGDSVKQSSRLGEQSLESMKSGSSNESGGGRKHQSDKIPLNLVDQLSITRITESLESFDCVSTTSHQSADRHSNKSSHSQINQRLESTKELPQETTRDKSENRSSKAEESMSSSNDVNQKEARLLEHERLALGGFERPSSRRAESPSESGKGRGTAEEFSATRSVGRSSSSSHRSAPTSAQAAGPQLTALEQLAITTVPTGSSDQVTSAPPSLARRSSGISDGDEATSIWSQSVAGEDRSESEQLSARSLLSQSSARSHHSRLSATSNQGQMMVAGHEKVSTSRPSSAHSSQGVASQSVVVDRAHLENTPAATAESTPASRPESATGKHGDDTEEDRQSECSNLTERVASLLSRPAQEGLTLVQVTPGEDSRPLSAASVETLKDNPLEGIESLGVPNVSEGRNLESPHSQFSDSSSTSYQDLPSSINPHVLAMKPRVAAIAETSFEEQPLSRCSTAAMSDDTMDPEVKKILKKYGEVMSEDDRREDLGPFSSSHRATPTGSVAESDDTNLTHRVNRLLHGTSDLDKSYLYEDPARSITLGMASGSTTRTNTPPPTVSDLNTFSKSNESLQRIQKGSSSRPKSRGSIKDSSDHRRPTEEDSLSDRMRHLLSDGSTGPGSVSSGRSSRTGSVNYDVLQNDLEEIQLGLAILQNGELALDHAVNSVGSSRRMSDASEGTASKVTGSEVGTPRKFSWDYGDLNGEDTTNFRFVTSRSDLQAHGDQKKTQRGEPEGISDRTEAGGVQAKTSTSDNLYDKSSESITTEGKYTRIARELEKETSPQRRAPLSMFATDSGPASWSGANSRRYDFIGRSYESLTRSGIDAEVERISTKKKSHSEDSNSFTQKVHNLMERESPQRQAYRYLAEAEDSIRIMEAKRGSRLHASDTELNNTSTHDASSASSSFRMTPIPARSFQAFGNVQSFLTTQLTKMSTAQFDTSVELRSPIKRHMEKQFVATGASRSSELSRSSEFARSSELSRSSEFAKSSELSRSSEFAKSSELARSSELVRNSELTRNSELSRKSDLPRNSELSRGSEFRDSVSDRLRAFDPPSEQTSLKPSDVSQRQKASSSVRPEHAERNERWDAVRVEMESRISDTMAEYVPMPRPVTMQDYVNGTYRNTLTDRRRERERSKEDLNEDTHEDLSLKPTENPKTPADRSGLHSTGDTFRDLVGAAAADQVVEDQLTPRSDGSVDSVVGAGSAPRSARSDRSDRRSSNNLRPYRPPGSNDLYYVESGTDDGNASVANSETTIESTHIGSDDAHAPHFPSHWLGSRSDPTTPTSTGLYSQLKPSTLQLDPIVENKSFEEPKPHEVSSSEDKTLIEESFAGKNRSHHNNSGFHEVSDASTGSEDQAAGSRGARSEDRRDPRGENSEMRFLHEDLEGGRWEKYHQPEVYAGHQRQEAAPRYNDIPVATSTRHWPDLGRYPGDDTPNRRTHHPTVSTAFGTPQRHTKSTDSTPSYADTYPRRGQDPYSLNDTGHSLQDSYRQYAGSRDRERGDTQRGDSRDQFDTTEDEISSRLRLYPGEEVHTMEEETLEQSPVRFTPLRHDKDDDVEVEVLSERGSSLQTSPERFSSSRTSPLRATSSRTSLGRVVSPPPVSHRYHVTDQSPEHRHKSHYRSPPPMSAPTPPQSRPDSTSPTRRSARSVSPDPARRSPAPRSPPTRRNHVRESNSERVVERPPAGVAPRHAWSETPEGSRQIDEALRARTAELPRGISERERLHARESLDSEASNTDVNALWEKFQRRYTDSSSDGEGGNVKDVDLKKLSSLIKNPVQHVTQEVAASRSQTSTGGRTQTSTGGRTQQERQPGAAEQHHEGYYQDDRQYEEGHRRSGPSSRGTSHRASRSYPVSEQPSPSHAQSVTFHTDTATATPASDLTAKSAATSRRDEATLQSIPEDTTLESISTDVTSSDSNGTVSLIQRLPDDPKLLKLQTKILRQRQKYEMEKVREQRRRQKINKLESLLAAKQSTESVPEYQTGHHEAARHHGFTRPMYESDYRSSQHTTGPFTSEHSSPTTRPMSTSSGKSTSTPASLKGTSGEDMSFAVSEITSMYGGTRGAGRSDESSDTLVDEASSKGTTVYTTTQDETTPQQSEAESVHVCACCHKKKGKSKSKSHQRTSDTRSKSPSKVRSRSKSPQKITSKSKSPSKTSRAHSPLKHKSTRSPSPPGKRHSVRSHSPTSKKSRHREEYEPEEEQQYTRMEKPLKEHHNRNASYLEFEKPTHSHAERHDTKNTRRKETLRERGTQHRPEGERPKAQQRQRKTEDRGSKENRDRQKENRSQKQPTSKTQCKDEKSDTFEIDDEESIEESPAVRTIGINVPTPISLSPPTRRRIRDVTMISEAVQTTPNLHDNVTSGDSSNHERHVSPGRRHKHGAFTPESSPDSSTTENVQPSRREQPKAAAAQTGLAWYIPLKESRPWRQPLRERQAHAVSMETWPPRHEAWRAGYDLGSSWEPPKATTTSDAEIYLTRANELRKQEEAVLQPKLSLQEAFERRKQEFISVSRERQKHLALKSEERHIQDVHSRQRAELFRIDRKLDPNKNAHPYSENLYQPKKRVMTKKEMKELTNKKYANLEEVVKREEDSKRTDEYRANRMRAQNYKHKILSKVLHKKAAWVE